VVHFSLYFVYPQTEQEPVGSEPYRGPVLKEPSTASIPDIWPIREIFVM
jgi:hypothetical protein